MSNPTPPIPPHLALPVTLASDGSLSTVDQDTLEDVTQCVTVLLGTVQRTRVVVPDFGVPDFTFAGADPVVITDQVARWEPRAHVTVTVAPDTTEPVSVHVRLKGSP